jgi:hypothetical protein
VSTRRVGTGLGADGCGRLGFERGAQPSHRSPDALGNVGRGRPLEFLASFTGVQRDGIQLVARVLVGDGRRAWSVDKCCTACAHRTSNWPSPCRLSRRCSTGCAVTAIPALGYGFRRGSRVSASHPARAVHLRHDVQGDGPCAARRRCKQSALLRCAVRRGGVSPARHCGPTFGRKATSSWRASRHPAVTTLWCCPVSN